MSPLRWHPARLGMACALALVLSTETSLAANPCEDGGALTPPTTTSPGNGIGGTGQAPGGGIGGTGQSEPTGASGISGTGQSDQPGIAGTGRNEENGIGGTGNGPKDPGDGGIGGTGYVRGIFGTVTGYASLCVAGFEIEYDASATATAAIGETVEILAEGTGDVVRAISIVPSPILSGPIETIDTELGTIRVLSQDIAFDEATRSRGDDVTDVNVKNAGLSIGDYVRIHGLRRSDSVIEASRIDRSDSTDLLLRGTITTSASGSVEVGALGVDVAALGPKPPSVGEDVLLIGRLDGNRMVATAARRPFALLDRRNLRRLDVEAFVGAGSRDVRLGDRLLALPKGAATGKGGRMRLAARIAHGGVLVFEGARPPIARRPPLLQPRPLAPIDGGAGGGADLAPGDALAPRAPRPDGAPSGADRPRPPQPVDRLQRPERPLFPDRPPRPPRPPGATRPPRPDRPPRPPRPPRLGGG